MNIFQKSITPDMPRVLEGEQIYVYVPQATSTNAGIASYKNSDFKVNDGVVSLRWPAEYFVQKVPQNLTDAEQQQARENIGAGSLAVVEQSNQNSSAALKAANNALSNSTDAINIANNALSKSADATNIANNALSKSADATNIANTALSNSTEAINVSNEARASAYDAFETSNTAKQNSVNAIQTAQESNIISAEAKIIAQNALDLITEGVGTQVLVNGVSVATFNADIKADITYVNQKIDEIMGPGSTEAIDTILELAEAFKTNSDIIKVLNTSISTKADKSEIPTEYIKSASVSADGKTLTITPLIGNSISFKGGIELPTNLVTTDTTQRLSGIKYFDAQTNFSNVLQLNSESNVGGETSRIIFYNPNVNLADPNPSTTQVLGQISSAFNGGGYGSKMLTYRNTSGTVVWSLDLRNNSSTDGVYDYNNDKYKTPIIAYLSKSGTPTINLNGVTTNTSSNFVVKKGSNWSQFTAYSASNYYRAFEADDSRIRLDVRNTNGTDARRFIDIYSQSSDDNNNTAVRIVKQIDGVTTTDYVATQSWVNTQTGNYLPLSGGTMTGTLNFTGDGKITSSSSVIRFGNSSTVDALAVLANATGTTYFRPGVADTMDLGTSSQRWKDVYLSRALHGHWTSPATARLTSLNLAHQYINSSSSGQPLVRIDLSTGSCSEGKPGSDGYVMTFMWDNTGIYDTQFFLSNGSGTRPQIRHNGSGGWSAWKSFAIQEEAATFSSINLLV